MKMYDLEALAKEVMESRGLKPDFSQEVFDQIQLFNQPAKETLKSQDLRSLLWCSIDNDDSKDLDQLTYAEKHPNGNLAIWVAVADVEGLVKLGTAVDDHAKFNTTSVYTPAKVFSMLPEKLSTNLTSLNENQDRMAIVIHIIFSSEGEVITSDIFPAQVHNHAKLTYNGVGDWLSGTKTMPEKLRQISHLAEVIQCQNEIAQVLERKRRKMGALTLEPTEVEAKVIENQIIFTKPNHNPAHQIIENFMIAANHAMALKFHEWKIPSLRRVVKIPKRWDRIVEIAKELGEYLPASPDPAALNQFLEKRKKSDPDSFPDLSLTVIKLLGRGEYVVVIGNEKPQWHFGLAITEYMHSTAPNRRFPDLISQRLYKSYINKMQNPYSLATLSSLAQHCTQQEDAAKKVERHLNKSAAAIVLEPRIGSQFSGIITGASEKGTWVRIDHPTVEGKVLRGYENLDVGDKVVVKLISVDIFQGYINFAVAKSIK